MIISNENPSMPLRAVIYARISSDKTGAGLGIERQVADCRALALEHGWQVVQVFTDNDISAYSGKHRPGYQALLKFVASGQADVVTAWHADRLHRRNRELEHYIEICGNVATHTVKAGNIDLSTPAGRAIARTLGAWASYEVETSTARVKAAKLQQAKAGQFSGGQRPFGYESACKAIRESEAAIYRELVGRVIDGESFNSCALDLNARGIKTTNGNTWIALKVRNMLTHKRYAGIRQHYDQDYEAEWEAIISRDTLEQLQMAVLAHARLYKQRGPMRRFLLTGFAHCGKCGNRLNTAPRNGKSRYVCRHFSDLQGEIGCAGIARLTEPVDHFVTECVLFRLESAAFTHELSQVQQESADMKELMRRHRVQAVRLHEIKEEYASGVMSKTDRDLYLSTATEHLADLSRQVEQISVQTTLSNIPIGKSARAAWEASDLAWKRQVLSLLIERIVIERSDVSRLKTADWYEGWKFRPEDITISWLN